MSQLRNLLFCLFLLWHVAGVDAKPPEERREEQRHGYVFEKWVRDTFFNGYQPGYTAEWDVAKEANTKYGNVPVSIKMTKYGTSVDLGDALRQFDIDEEFLLIIGYWKQEGDRKRIVNIQAITVQPAVWQPLWSPIARADLEKLDAVIKNRQSTPDEARAAAQKLKRMVPYTRALITLNPKIDDATQRRLQCSLRFRLIFERLAPTADALPQEKPQLFGIPAPAPWESKPRSGSEKRGARSVSCFAERACEA